MKVDELEGMLLDYWVARAEGFTNTIEAFESSPVPYSLKWEYGGLIIERERISAVCCDGNWFACICGEEHWIDTSYYDEPWGGPTPLVAAMRSYVASKFGDEVPDAGSIPDPESN